jgi:hypothetical protein
MSRRLTRRGFLAGLGGGASALALSRMAHAGATRAPTRLLVIHKATGTQPERYDCAGGPGRDFELSYILEPFADLRDRMVIVEGLDVKKKPNTPNEDHGNSMATFMTGGVTERADASANPLATRISIDQILAGTASFVGDAPIPSLQLAADSRTGQLFTRILSWAGPGAPMPPENQPLASYTRVFGSLAGGGLAPAELEQVVRRKQSVLDFTRTGAQRLAARLDGVGRERLDRHLSAIREVELVLHRTAGCVDAAAIERQARGVDPLLLDANHGLIGRTQLDLVRAAFQCDVSRVATFGWTAGASMVNFSGLIPGVENVDFHAITHGGVNKTVDEARVHRWYNEQMAAYLRTLRDTVDLDGRSLLDNTLVVVWSEMRLGQHSFTNVPIQLFGGAGGRLEGGRLVRYEGRPTNDLWLTVANVLGLGMTGFGDAERCTGELPGLFHTYGAAPSDEPTTMSTRRF